MIVEADCAGPARLDRALALAFPELSRSRLAALIESGQARVDGAVVLRPSAKVTAGARLRVDVPEPTPTDAAPEDLPLRVVYEDADLAVIDKAPGMVVHPSAGHRTGTLVNALLHHLEGLSGLGGELRPGIVHRLDRGTSGLLVVAKHDRAHRSLSRQFHAHTAGRIYLAVVHRPPSASSGTCVSFLARDPRDRLRQASTDGSSGRRAVTHWAVVGRADAPFGLVRCRLETGRTHQVRVHLSELGSPIVGDGRYRRGDTTLPVRLKSMIATGDERPLLHAWRLALDHPTTGERLSFEATIPSDLRVVLEALALPTDP